MWTLETDRVRSEGWDPALWSIGAVLGAAIVYLTCLSQSRSLVLQRLRSCVNEGNFPVTPSAGAGGLFRPYTQSQQL